MIKILQGNCIDKIKELDDNSIDCVVSSPPYFGLRDYGVDGQFGLEKTYQEYVANTVKVFETFKPKLKNTATIWWNVGDSYLNYKNLIMIPNRVAISLQDIGWYIRSEIIWHKPNPMPESVRDRPTSCHEKIWLITKNKKYYYDADAIKEDSIYAPNKTHEKERPKGYYKGKWSCPEKGSRHDGSFKAIREKRNKRNVWTIPTKPFKHAHFATFPPKLIEPCIKAGCPEGGIVLDPFGGSGTTGIVAALNNRNAILIELNEEYINIAKKRIDKEIGLFNENISSL
jgi:DNA modification methylase